MLGGVEARAEKRGGIMAQVYNLEGEVDLKKCCFFCREGRRGGGRKEKEERQGGNERVSEGGDLEFEKLGSKFETGLEVGLEVE